MHVHSAIIELAELLLSRFPAMPRFSWTTAGQLVNWHKPKAKTLYL
jgi:hypothetical protein